MALTFNVLLREAGFEPYNVRLARHLDTRKGVKRSPYTLWRTDIAAFELYQQVQGGRKFRVGNYLASFVITPQGHTLFVGMYQINTLGVAPAGMLCPIRETDVEGLNFYSISRDDRMSELIGRLTINWGPGARSWVQLTHRREKNVIEIRRDFEDEPFPGYFHFRCVLTELINLPSNWTARLREARGVYVLTSMVTGAHYVGSAAGVNGFYGRWSQHAAVGGDAAAFKDLAPSDYQVAILQVSAGFESESDIVRTEHAWMDKLQSRSMGLNGTPTTSVAPEPF